MTGKKGLIQIFGGSGKGKTSAAIGQGIKAAAQGKTVVFIQFLKGNADEGIDIVKRLEPEIKLFSFEKSSVPFDELSPSDQEEEKQNIMNGFNFARKVLATGECDVLILDEFLGLIDTGLLTISDFQDLLSVRPEEVSVIMTGINIDEDMCFLADEITELKTVYVKE